MALSPEEVIKKVIKLIEPVIEDLDYDLVDAEYITDHGRWTLRVFIDKEGGVNVEDCARVSNEIGDLLDVKDIIPHQYVLEVSSPGLNRPLRKEKDFAWAVGKKVKIKTRMPLNGRRNFTGILKNCGGGKVVIETNGASVEISIGEMEKANLIYEF